jgi:hypothetical protein
MVDLSHIAHISNTTRNLLFTKAPRLAKDRDFSEVPWLSMEKGLGK